MGGCLCQPLLLDIKRRTEKRDGKLSSRRYHYLPKKLEHDYKLTTRCLGSGANATVRVVIDKHTQHTYAMKQLRLSSLTCHEKNMLKDECEVLLVMDHPHVVRLVDVYESRCNVQFVMEHLKGGELFDRAAGKFEKGQKYSDEEASQAVRQMLLAVNYLHENGVVHRDIKPQNFVYESLASEHLKLIDFGFSRMCGSTQMSQCCGTLSYCAPEVHNRQYTKQCDLWALGVTAFILISGRMPFGGPGVSGELKMSQIMSGSIDWFGVQASAEAKTFIKRLLVVHPSLRLDAGKALADPWITKHCQKRTMGSHVDNTIVEAFLRFEEETALRRACMLLAATSVVDDAKLRNAFLEMDRNHDGKITTSEFEQALEAKGCTQSALKNVFDAIQLNENNEIRYSDFLAVMFSSPHLELNESRLCQVFWRMDTDGSGVLTHSKLIEAIPKQLMDKFDLPASYSLSCKEFVALVGPDAPKSKMLSNHSKSGCSKSLHECSCGLATIAQVLQPLCAFSPSACSG